MIKFILVLSLLWFCPLREETDPVHTLQYKTIFSNFKSLAELFLPITLSSQWHELNLFLTFKKVSPLVKLKQIIKDALQTAE